MRSCFHDRAPYLRLDLIGFPVIYELGVVTQFRDEASYLSEWITYHRLVGVDHFWLYDDGSTDAWREVLATPLAEGVVEVLPLPESHGPNVPTAIKQPGTFRDGLRRASGRARWVALIDVDEFLLPKTEATIPACLDRHFSTASGVYANWRMFGTNQQVVPLGSPLLPVLTGCSQTFHPENGNGKSLVRPEHVALERVWSPHHFPLRAEGRYLDGGGNVLSFGIRHEREDLLTTGAHVDTHLRINHYNLRDEGFFAANRLARARAGRLPGKSLERLVEHYDSFGKIQDREILEFLESRHPVGYESFWGIPGGARCPG